MTVKKICASDRVLLHVGYHKTATTWFQSELFSNESYGFTGLAARNSVHKAFCDQNPFSSETNDDLASVISQAEKVTAAGGYFVVSHERLSGYPASGGFDAKQVAERLKKHFPNARVFGLFREQHAMILSAWRQQIVDGGGTGLKHFLNPPEPHIRRMPLFDVNMYRYSRLIRHYFELFGKNNVRFLPYEEFCARPKDVVLQLAELVGNEKLKYDAAQIVLGMKTPNPSLSDSILLIHRFLNICFARTQLSQNCIIDLGSKNIRAAMRLANKYVAKYVLRPADVLLRRRASKMIAYRCEGVFEADNAALSVLIGRNLVEFDYHVNP